MRTIKLLRSLASTKGGEERLKLQHRFLVESLIVARKWMIGTWKDLVRVKFGNQ